MAWVEFAIELLVFLDHSFENLPCFFGISIKFQQQSLVVVNTELCRVFWWEIGLNVLSVRIEYHLSLLVLAQGHTLLKLLQ